ncbi:hypothetical protein D9615_007298 [Tricholomella constricta]|uniref:F-box domain-containing protein n=1 Tax=Tricholomella constricta TaxID=117010 RepID=A0A8H5H563_9AGAR|nr:hypothetical protein D9615_007298 [Tricholomella constricta]
MTIADIIQKLASEELPPTTMNARRLFGSFSCVLQPPSSHLPNELLSEIFLLAAHNADDRYGTISTPITVSQVSTRWRNVAISTGKLWNTIIITFPTSRGQISRAITWLKRSMPYPLDFFLDFRDPSWNWELAESSHAFRWQDMEAILRLLIVHVRRWRRFELLTDTWAPIFTFLHYSRRVDSAPILETLSLSRCNAFFATKDATFAPVEMRRPLPLFGGLVMDRLREVSLTGVHVDWTASSLCHLTSLEFKYLASDVTPSKNEFIDILNACPDLRHLTIIGRGPQTRILPSSGNASPADESTTDVVPKPPQIIELSHLTSFTFGFVDSSYALEVLSMFSFPAIKKFVLEGIVDLDPLSLQSLDSTPILERLAPSNPSSTNTTPFPLSRIHSLELQGINASKATFMRLFNNLEGLEYLGLFNTENDALRALEPPSSDPPSPSCTLPCPTLEDLACRNMDPGILAGAVQARLELSPLQHVSFESKDINPDDQRKLLDAGVQIVRDATGNSSDLSSTATIRMLAEGELGLGNAKGIYLILMQFLIGIFIRHGMKRRATNIVLLFVTVLMFLGGTLFLCLDVADLVRRMQIIMVNNSGQPLQEKLDQANEALKKLVWTGTMLFVFMLILGDSVVVWRTWVIFKGSRKWVAIPMATWIGSLIAGLFELGCDIHTDWAITSLSPSAASVGAESCAHADLSSYTLSFVTNIFCTALIAFKAWQHRKLMSKYLGAARRKTAVEKILTLLIESGFVYLILYTLQAVPIYKAKLNSSGLFAFNVVNAVIQQAMGMYPTVIIILVRMQKSIWETTEVSQGMFTSKLQFAAAPLGEGSNATETIVSDFPTHTSGMQIAMVDLNSSGDQRSDHKRKDGSEV